MSVRLAAINLFLRLVEKPWLARAKDPLAARARFEATARRWFRTPADANVIEDRLEGPAGPIPTDWVSRGRPDRRAVVIYLHGGAYMMGSRATHRHVAAWLAGFAGARVALPEYRLAPEHPYPAATDDALACYRALLDSGYDPARIAFAGDSAGGGLGFATLLRARAEGLPDPGCVAAFSPWLDLTMSQPSITRNARRDPMLPAGRFREVAGYYLGASDPRAPFASPLYGDLSAPPPSLIQASRIELLADEADEMAERLRAAGGDVRLEWMRKAPHAWQLFAGLVPEAMTSLASAGGFIRAKLDIED